MDIDISIFFTTATEAKDFSSRLSRVASKLYEMNFNFEKALTEAIGVIKKDALMILMRDNNISDTSPEAIKSVIDGMQRYIASLPVLSLAVAFEPNEDTINVLNEWFIMNVKKQVLFDITVDKKIIAGSIIHFKGKYKDYSISPIFQKVLEDTLAQSISSPSPSVAPSAPLETGVTT